jgi:hypothetical protein
MATRAELLDATRQLVEYVAESRWPAPADPYKAAFHRSRHEEGAADLIVSMLHFGSSCNFHTVGQGDNEAFEAEQRRREMEGLRAAVDADAGMSDMYRRLVVLAIVALFDALGFWGDRERAFPALPIVFPRIARGRRGHATLHTTIELRHVLSNRALVAFMRGQSAAPICRVPPSVFKRGELFSFLAAKGVTHLRVGESPVDLADPRAEARLVDGFWAPESDVAHEPWTDADAEFLFALEPQVEHIRGAASIGPQAPWPPPRSLRTRRGRGHF